ncbi:MAG: hypothetical protein AB9903_26530 [Vulcanimicrobiota bacterium]
MTNAIQGNTLTSRIFNNGASLDLSMLKEEVSTLQNSIKDEFVKNDAPLHEIKGQDIMNKCTKPESKGLFSGLKTAGTMFGGLLTGYAIGEISKNMELNDNEVKERGSLNPVLMNAGRSKENSSAKDKLDNKPQEIIKPQVKIDIPDVRIEDVMETAGKDRTSFINFSDFKSPFKEEALLSTDETLKQDSIRKRELDIKKTIESVKKDDNTDIDSNPEKGKVIYNEYDLTYDDSRVKYFNKSREYNITRTKIYTDNEKYTLFKNILKDDHFNNPSSIEGYFIDKSTNTYYVWDADNYARN